MSTPRMPIPDDSICPKNDAIYRQNEECKGGCERSGWIEDILREHRNTKYYRDIVVNICALFGNDAYIQDDGNRTDSVLCDKVLELATSAMATKQQLETEAERLREALQTISMSMKDLRKSNAAHIKIGMDMLESLAQEALGKNNTALEPK